MTNSVLDIDLGYDALREMLLRVGYVRSKAGLVSGVTDKDVVQYGARNHYGDDSHPARPFITETWDNGGEALYADYLADELLRIIDTPETADIQRVAVVFHGAAELASEGIVHAIDTWPVSAGDDKALHETGALRAGIAWTTKAKATPFREETTGGQVTAILGGSKSKSKRRGGAKKRKRKVSFRKRAAGLKALAKGSGYGGKGIRKSAERRSSAASGVTSRGVRRKGSAF